VPIGEAEGEKVRREGRKKRGKIELDPSDFGLSVQVDPGGKKFRGKRKEKREEPCLAATSGLNASHAGSWAERDRGKKI